MTVAMVKTVKRWRKQSTGLSSGAGPILRSECCVEYIETDRKVHQNKVCVTAGNLKRMKYQHKIQNSMHKTRTHSNQTKTHHEGGKVGTTSHPYPRS